MVLTGAGIMVNKGIDRGYATYLSEQTGYRKDWVSRVLTAKIRPSYERALLLAEVSGVPLAVWMTKDMAVIADGISQHINGAADADEEG
jgi:transcriptional regulator with XRE-family HTH domain